MSDPISFFFAISILIMSVVVHELSHGYAAEALGDPTAKMAGRLTLNPIKHLDLIGSFIVPVTTFFLGGFILGWAKPVPYNPYNLGGGKWGPALVAFAGPMANIFLAIIFGFALRFFINGFDTAVVNIISLIVFINLILAVFNLIPIPPLDGSKILFSALPYRFHHVQVFMEQYWIFFILFFIFFLWQIIIPIVFFLFQLLTGVGF
ncbi:site-2 protease family protein [Candidatus Falkowbacteria bacterium CG10_big_fil_rev_8_21_14_0_10_37_6]|uniref:Site-2 protease family protein n=1 Tax=Candidatus Falkowbacteria bacterium CG10_big_fil_rev_8_21_14_0_10_37_6 TaxID=1974563 RepID=A0A2H0V9T9_9BACT|nr:MAG: site-2 protease family protein [Candidatus Falkowbacteria bacterium CG10_big_fil_rev_8_21_14_0_10_37_6]